MGAQPANKNSIFATCGMMARPAGVAGMMASDPRSGLGDVYYGQQVSKGVLHSKHALRVATPYAEATPAKWYPREPAVKPNQRDKAAGVVSAGSIDNTYLPAPLRNAWGKAREMSRREVEVKPRGTCTDLLVVSKGAKMPAPAQEVADMKTVREAYSKCIPGLRSMDPQRFDSGFVRDPNIIPGAKPPPKFYKPDNLPACGPDWRMQKLKYDQTAGDMRINLSRVVSTAQDRDRRRPGSAPPKFMTVPAGLPGGLSLV